MALILTLLILVGYAGYVAYDKVMGSDSPAATTNDAYVTATHRAMFIGGGAIGAGINLRNLKDQYTFKDQITGQIDLVRTERANLEGLLSTASGPQADTIRATIQSIDALMIAMAQWRDTIFNLRLGNVDNAQSAIESVLAQMAQQLETWNGLEAP